MGAQSGNSYIAQGPPLWLYFMCSCLMRGVLELVQGGKTTLALLAEVL